MRKWSNSRGEGTLFSIDLLDEEGSEIKGTFFKAEAERWYEQLQEGQVYRFCGGKIKVCASCSHQNGTHCRICTAHACACARYFWGLSIELMNDVRQTAFPPRRDSVYDYMHLLRYDVFFLGGFISRVSSSSGSKTHPQTPPQVANKKFSSLKSEYEITFDQGTRIDPVEDDSRILSMT